MLVFSWSCENTCLFVCGMKLIEGGLNKDGKYEIDGCWDEPSRLDEVVSCPGTKKGVVVAGRDENNTLLILFVFSMVELNGLMFMFSNKLTESFAGSDDVISHGLIFSLVLAPKREALGSNLNGSLLELVFPHLLRREGFFENEGFNFIRSDEVETKEDDVDGLSLWQQIHFSFSPSFLTKQVEQDHFLIEADETSNGL